MRGSKLLIIMLALMFGTFMANCNGDGNGEDDVEEEGDGVDMDAVEEEVVDEDVPDADAPADLPAEDGTVEDMPTEEVTPDVPTDEAPGECVEAAIACGEALTDQTTIGKPDRMNGYSCADALDESGGEVVYSLTTDAHMFVTVTLTINTAGQDMDLFLMTGECEPESMCIGYSAGTGSVEAVAFESMPEETYYIIVDGWSEAAADFDISVTCKDAEICDNQEDDNEDGLIDCSDTTCEGDEACTETECDDETDNDHDGYADCEDADCIEAENCLESDCGDDVDNDGDGDVDCEDWDCFYDEEGACTGEGVVGDACDSHDDCESGQCLTEYENGWPAGYCVFIDLEETCDTIECPENSTCVSFGIFGPYGCIADCGEGCRVGYECIDIDDDTTEDVCVPGCDDNEQCVETGFCDIPEDETTGNCGIPPEICTVEDPAVDEDMDGLFDCDDPDCELDEACVDVVELDGGDLCADAAAITLPEGDRGTVVIAGTTTGAADDIQPACVSSDSLDVAYTFTLEGSAFVTIDMMGGPEAPLHTDTALSVRLDCDAPDVLCNDDYGMLYHSRVAASLAAGTYYIICDGYSEAAGDFNLGITVADLP